MKRLLSKPVVKISVILGLVAPYLSILSGLIAAWLFVHIHILGIFHIGQSGVQQAIFGGVVFGLTSLLTYAAAHWHWLPVVIEQLRRQQAIDDNTTPSGSVVSPTPASGGTVSDTPTTGPAPGATIPGARRP